MKINHNHKAGRALRAASVALVFALAAMLAGCTFGTEAACLENPRNIVVVAATSVSDIETSRKVAGKVGKNAAEIAAKTCGTLSVAMLTNAPQADLALASIELTSAYERVSSREAVVRQLTERAEKHATAFLTDPLAQASATRGSPFLGGLVKVGEELQSQNRTPATIVLIGDLIDVEPAADGAGTVDLRTGKVDAQALRSFDRGLKALKGSCVVALAAGADSGLPESTITVAREAVGQTVRRGGASFKATRSIEIPPCN